MIKIARIANLLGVLGMITVNALANILPINGYTTGELSAMYPNLFTPAGFTFSIWSVIYLGLLAFAIYQLRCKKAIIERIGALFFLNALLNCGWILLWHHKMIVLSVFVMLGLLVTLILIYQRLSIGTHQVKPAVRWLVHAPFSVYLGWISIATVANVTALLVAGGWQGWGLPANFWTAAMIFVAAVIGLFMLIRARDWLFALVVLWAFFGIAYKRYFLDDNMYPVIYSTLAFAAIMIISRMIRMRKELN